MNALKRSFQGASHQRRRVHFVRNLLAGAFPSRVDMVAAVFRTFFAQPDAEAVSKAWDEVRDQLAKSLPEIGHSWTRPKPLRSRVPAGAPEKIWSTSPLEWVNKQIKCRAWSGSCPTPQR